MNYLNSKSFVAKVCFESSLRSDSNFVIFLRVELKKAAMNLPIYLMNFELRSLFPLFSQTEQTNPQGDTPTPAAII